MPRHINGLRGPEAVLFLKGHRIWPSELNIFQEYQSPRSRNSGNKLLWKVSFLLLFLWSWLMNYTKYKMNSLRRWSLCFPVSTVLSIPGKHKRFRPLQSYTDWDWLTAWPVVLSPHLYMWLYCQPSYISCEVAEENRQQNFSKQTSLLPAAPFRGASSESVFCKTSYTSLACNFMGILFCWTGGLSPLFMFNPSVFS